MNGHEGSHLGFFHTHLLSAKRCGQLTRCDDNRALGYLAQEELNIGLFHHLKIFVAGRILCTDDLCTGIVEGDATRCEKRL